MINKIVIYTRNLDTTQSLYNEGLGLATQVQSSDLVVLKDQSGVQLVLKRVEQEAYCSKGFSP